MYKPSEWQATLGLTQNTWWHLSEWLVSLSVLSAPEPHYQRPTVLESLVSFVLYHDGQRLITGLTEQDNGEWVSTQLTHFRTALRNFQHLANSEMLLGEGGHLERIDWMARLGFPKQERLSIPIWVPNWDRVRQALAQASASFGLICGAHTVPNGGEDGPWADLGRRWGGNSTSHPHRCGKCPFTDCGIRQLLRPG